MAKIRTLGVYVGLAVDPAVDWEDVCSKAAAAGYTGIALFLTTLFYGKMQPWPWTGTEYDFSQINPEYRAHFKRGCLAFKKHNLSMHLCIVDQFRAPQGANDNPHDPFASLSVEALYSSWDGSKKTWLWWSDEKDPKYLATPQLTLKQYKVIGPIGNGMLRFLQMLANILRTTGVKFSLKWGNETFGRADRRQSRGDRDECVIWARSMLQAAGLEFDLYFDFLAFKGGVGPKYIDYPVMHLAFEKGIRGKHKAKLEVHGILNVADTQKFGFTVAEQKYIKWSTDGDKRMEGDYPGLGKSALFDVDLKMDRRVVPEKTATQFFNNLMPKYAKYVI